MTGNTPEMNLDWFSEERIANGDGVVAVAHFQNPPNHDAMTLGTGFESPAHLKAQIEHAVLTGEPTVYITMENAERLFGADEVAIYTIAGDMTIEIVDK
jgi:hypothetical protein